MINFNDRQIEFIDDLLLKTSNGDVNYSVLDYNEYNKTFPFLNKPPYHLFDTDGNNIWLSQLGNEIINDFNGNFKSYLESIKTEQELDKSIKVLTIKDIKWTSIRGWIAIGISIVALFVASLGYVNKHDEPKYDDTKNKINPTNNFINSTEIDTLSNNNIINRDTFSTKIIEH